MPYRFKTLTVLAMLATLVSPRLAADDWPEWRGQGRLGVWEEDGILETFPEEGLEVTWRVPIRSGYAGPSVAGGRLWESMAPVVEMKRWASAFLVRQGGRYFISNDRGELVIARLGRQGLEEVYRTQLVTPTSPASRRREKGAVHWSHPAYANRHVVVRNDDEILRADLGAR